MCKNCEENKYQTILNINQKEINVKDIEVLLYPEKEERRKSIPFDLLYNYIDNYFVFDVCKKQQKSTKGKYNHYFWLYLCYDFNKKKIVTKRRERLIILRNKNNIDKKIKIQEFDGFIKDIFCPVQSYYNFKGERIGDLIVLKEVSYDYDKGNHNWCCISLTDDEIFYKTSEFLCYYKKEIENGTNVTYNIKNSISRKNGSIVNNWKLLNKIDENSWDCECVCCGERKIIKSKHLTITFCNKRINEANKELEELKNNPLISKTPKNIKDKTGFKKGQIEILGYGKKILNHHYWIAKCLKCGKIFPIISTSLYKNVFSCGCIHSKGELKIFNFLKKYNINFITQYKIKECSYINPLPFDFLIYYKNSESYFLLEFQGQQHEMPFSFSSDKSQETKEKNYEIVKTRDKIKKEYCKNNNIELLEISYRDYDKIDEILAKKLGIELENAE